MRLDPNRRVKRKMRTAGKDMCSCGLLNCDSMHASINSPYIRKLRIRHKAKVCIACGKKPCECKRKMKNGIIYTDELKKKRTIKMYEQSVASQKRMEELRNKLNEA